MNYQWAKQNLKQPIVCDDCGYAMKVDWISVSGKYKEDTNDYKALCVKCSKKFRSKQKEVLASIEDLTKRRNIECKVLSETLEMKNKAEKETKDSSTRRTELKDEKDKLKLKLFEINESIKLKQEEDKVLTADYGKKRNKQEQEIKKKETELLKLSNLGIANTKKLGDLAKKIEETDKKYKDKIKSFKEINKDCYNSAKELVALGKEVKEAKSVIEQAEKESKAIDYRLEQMNKRQRLLDLRERRIKHYYKFIGREMPKIVWEDATKN